MGKDIRNKQGYFVVIGEDVWYNLNAVEGVYYRGYGTMSRKSTS